jgi:sorting nexin-1/2
MKAYVFKPGKGDVKEANPVVKDNAQVQVKDDKKGKQDVKEETLMTEAGRNEAPEVPTEEPAKTTISEEPSKDVDPKDQPEDAAADESTPSVPETVSKPSEPESIPLPASEQVTPSPSRIASPIPTNATRNGNTQTFLSATNDLFSPSSTPKHDRVAVSPLDPPPPAEKDYGFKNLAIGGSSQVQTAPPPPPKSDWTLPTPSTGGSRFAGKGWAAVDETDDLFGGGGPSVKADPWGGADDGEGWAGDNVPTSSGPSKVCRNPRCAVLELTIVNEQYQLTGSVQSTSSLCHASANRS